MNAEMFVFAPMFALMALVVIGWTATEIARLRSRGLRFEPRYGLLADTERNLTVPAAPTQVGRAASNDEMGERRAA